MIQQKSVKGFTTVKFAISCCLLYALLYFGYLIYSIWDLEDQTVSKIIYFIIIVLSLCLIVLFNVVATIKTFLFGVGKYNQLRCVDQSRIKIPKYVQQVNNSNIKNNKHVKTKLILNETQPKHTQKQKLKKYHSFQPADLLKLSGHRPQQQNITTNTHKQIRSLSMSIPYSDEQYSILHTIDKIKAQQYKRHRIKYEQHLILNKYDQQIEKEKIKRVKKVVGNIVNREVKKHEDNLARLEEKFQSLFDIRVIKQYKKYNDIRTFQERTKYLNQRERHNKSIVLFQNQQQITIDRILELYKKGQLWRSGFQLRTKASQDQQYKIKLIKQVSDYIKQRIMLDRQVNFNNQFSDNKTRLKALQTLKLIVKSYMQNRYFQFSQQKYTNIQQVCIKKQITWILSRHYNSLISNYQRNIKNNNNKNTDKFNNLLNKYDIANRLLEATIYLEMQTNFANRKRYVRWIMDKDQVIVHFDQLFQKIQIINNNQEQNKRVKVDKKWYICLPGEDNIISLVVKYFTLLKQQFANQIGAIPELQAQVNQIWI